MDWILSNINVMLIIMTWMILITTLTGSIGLLMWWYIGKYLKKLGYTLLFYHLLWLVVALFIVPVSFIFICVIEKLYGIWGGRLFLPTPMINTTCQTAISFWSVGAVGVICKNIYEKINLYKICKNSIPCEVDKQQKFRDICDQLNIDFDKIKVYQNYSMQIPMIVGLFYPKIIIPVKDYTQNELDTIFKHELTHYQQKDIWLKHFVMFISCVQFFNPLVWWLHKVVKKWSEFACDYKACDISGGMKNYFGIILIMMEETEGVRSYFSSNLVENKNELLERVEFMKKAMREKTKYRGKACFLGVVLLLTSSMSVLAASAETADQYINLYFATEEAVKEELTEKDYLEHEEVLDDNIVQNIGEFGLVGRSSAFLWNVQANSLTKSSQFYVEAGKEICVSAFLDPTDKTVKLGIIDTSATKRYVTGSDSISHDFSITKSGYYRIFVENTNSVSVTADGYYTIR